MLLALMQCSVCPYEDAECYLLWCVSTILRHCISNPVHESVCYLKIIES